MINLLFRGRVCSIYHHKFLWGPPKGQSCKVCDIEGNGKMDIKKNERNLLFTAGKIKVSVSHKKQLL